MLGKAIRKAVLPILLASLMVGPGCRIVYGEADISLNERAENFTSDNTAASQEEQEKTTEPAVSDDALVQAPSALLMEASTGTVIYEKDSDIRRSHNLCNTSRTSPDIRIFFVNYSACTGLH